MNRILKTTVVAIVAVVLVGLSACQSGKYDQKVVDNLLEKENCTEADYKTLINQANYALDDAEKSGDLSKWVKENSEEAMSVVSIAFTLSTQKAFDSDFPSSLDSKVDALTNRIEELSSVLTDSVLDKVGTEISNAADKILGAFE